MQFALILTALVATVAAIPTPLKLHAADQDLLKKQQDVLYLLDKILLTTPHHHYHQLGLTYDIEQHVQEYIEPDVVKYYLSLLKLGDIQPKQTPFSLSVSTLRKECALVTRILIGAKHYDTFIKTASWARVHINEEQFVKALVAAILVRPDTQGIVPPALYEIFPQHYIDNRVIQHAQNVINNPLTKQSVIINVNYTDSLPFGEQWLTYFTHDIGLSLWHAYFGLAGWIAPENNHGRHEEQTHSHIGRGSIYYHLYRQLLGHYNLARYAHSLGPIKDISFETPDIYYKPHLIHINGLSYPGRDTNLNLLPKHHRLVKQVQAFEKRLIEAIDAGHIITPQQSFLSLYQPQGLNIIGDLIEGIGKSINPRFYGSLQAAARQLLGNVPDFTNIWEYTPAVLEQYESAVRDPAFFSLYKRILNLFQHYQDSLPAWQYNDVALPTVQIQEVVFPKLVTFFEKYSIDLDNAVHQFHNVEQQTVDIKAQVPRLNHKPYDYKIVVNAAEPIQNAVVRVYLGPKFDHNGKAIDINEHRQNFVELDQFVYRIQQGKNVIVRDSQHAPHLSYDYPSIKNLEVHLESAIRSQNPFYVHEPHQIFGFPARLSIPKGTYGGLPLQILVVIHSVEPLQIPYGPVVSHTYQTFQSSNYKVVSINEYPQVIQEHTSTGVQHTVDVIPIHQTGLTQHQVQKLQYYYGSYFYKKYPTSYPSPYMTHTHQMVDVPTENVQYYGQHESQQKIPLTPYGQMPYTQSHAVNQGLHQGVHHGLHHDQVGQNVYPGVHEVEGGHGYEHAPHSVYQHEGVQNVDGIYNHQQHNAEFLKKYYQNKHISHIIGGAVSLDNKPLGWPLDRPLAKSVLYAPNLFVSDVMVYHVDQVETPYTQ